VELGEKDAVVPTRDHELLDGVLLALEVRLLREEVLEAARRAAGHARVLRHVCALSLPDATLGLGGHALLLVVGVACSLGLLAYGDEAALQQDLL
jgi:phage tail protein X